jgi:methylated-DNA-protein-cysteine methyltransferase related protein
VKGRRATPSQYNPGSVARRQAASRVAARSHGGVEGFFKRVYAVVRRIPCGRVATYGQVAALLGNPRAARTVGWALRALPAGSDVPWHRVINGSGTISTSGRGYEAALQAQRLRRESVTIGREGRIALERFRWRPSRCRPTARR